MIQTILLVDVAWKASKVEISKQINDFIKARPSIEIVDIKLSVVHEKEMNALWSYALIIYKE